MRHNFPTARVMVISIILLTSINACVTHKAGQNKTQADKVAQDNKSVIDLLICKTNVSNSPVNFDGKVVRNSNLACVNNIELLIAPAAGACLSSGFGPRKGRKHKGVDFQSKPAGDVVAAAKGVISKVEYREKDFGNWVVIDHGNGVLTGYAHLKLVYSNIRVGKLISQGQRIGIMGSSGRAARAVHLHYEIRKGDKLNSKGWWGLTPVDPFKQSQNC